MVYLILCWLSVVPYVVAIAERWGAGLPSRRSGFEFWAQVPSIFIDSKALLYPRFDSTVSYKCTLLPPPPPSPCGARSPQGITGQVSACIVRRRIAVRGVAGRGAAEREMADDCALCGAWRAVGRGVYQGRPSQVQSVSSRGGPGSYNLRKVSGYWASLRYVRGLLYIFPTLV